MTRIDANEARFGPTGRRVFRALARLVLPGVLFAATLTLVTLGWFGGLFGVLCIAYAWLGIPALLLYSGIVAARDSDPMGRLAYRCVGIPVFVAWFAVTAAFAATIH